MVIQRPYSAQAQGSWPMGKMDTQIHNAALLRAASLNGWLNRLGIAKPKSEEIVDAAHRRQNIG